MTMLTINGVQMAVLPIMAHLTHLEHSRRSVDPTQIIVIVR